MTSLKAPTQQNRQQEHAAAQANISSVMVAATAHHLRDSAAALLKPVGFAVLAPEKPSARQAPDIVLAILEEDQLDLGPAGRWIGDPDRVVPLVVFGPANGLTWRKQALDAGAFACLSVEAPELERISLVVAASRYRAALAEIEVIRREAEIVVHELLKSYGAEAQRLQQAIQEANNVRVSLEKVRTRILRSML